METPPRFSILVYLDESRRPGVSLVFVLPILLTYEIGVQIMNLGRDEYTVNAADAILKEALKQIGFYGSLLSAFCIVLALLFLHMHKRLPWTLRPGTLFGMLIESLVVALPLFPLGSLVNWALMASPSWGEIGRMLVLSMGAGIYEEFLFRLLLLGGFVWVAVRIAGKERRQGAQAVAVLVAALLFSAFHHIGAEGDPFTLRVFAFRAVAGIYFAWIYLARGFGIAVGCHTAYDLMVVTLLALEGEAAL
ncbi:MAG: type II CAAX prenyl endopeptidase Rce1 family protein [Planctomycetota bacterium]